MHKIIKTNSRADLFSGLRITAHHNAIESLVITYQLVHEAAPLENLHLKKDKFGDTSSTVFFHEIILSHRKIMARHEHDG